MTLRSPRAQQPVLVALMGAYPGPKQQCPHPPPLLLPVPCLSSGPPTLAFGVLCPLGQRPEALAYTVAGAFLLRAQHRVAGRPHQRLHHKPHVSVSLAPWALRSALAAFPSSNRNGARGLRGRQ